MRRPALVTLLLAVLVLTSGTPAGAASGSGRGSGSGTGTSTTLPPPRAWIVVDADTGAVVAASNDREPLPPASLTKIMTAVVSGAALRPEDDLPVSARAAAQPANKVGAEEGQVWNVDLAMHVLLMQSANDLAMAFAERVGGSAEGFGAAMTAAAGALGMQDRPVLRDPAGLDDRHSVGGGNLVSARDMAIATRALLADPWLGPIVAKPANRFTDPKGVVHTGRNHNKLLHDRAYPGAVGVKTGFTRKAGRSLAAAAHRDGRTMIAVVYNVYDTYGWAARLLDQGFATPVQAQAGLERLPPRRPLRASDLRRPVPVGPSSSVVVHDDGRRNDEAMAGGDEVDVAGAGPAVATRPQLSADGGGRGGEVALAGAAAAGGGACLASAIAVRQRRRRRSTPSPWRTSA